MIILIVISYFALLLNLWAPPMVSSASPLILVTLHTFVLALGRIIVSMVLDNKLSKEIKDLYFCYFLLGLIIAMLLLHFIWTPSLNPNLESWGFDPKRYYYYATEIVREGYLFYSLNYQGVVYFYVACMKLLGVDPLVPLYVNVILSLYATLLIAKLFAGKNEFHKYVFLLIIPEVVSFNLMASREILCMAGATIFIVKYVEFKARRSLWSVVLMFFSFLLVAVVRPPMTAPLILGIVVNNMMNASLRSFIVSFFVLVILGGVFYLGMSISSDLGSNFDNETLEGSVSSGFSGKTEAREDAASSGMTVWLIPHNPVEYIVFGIIRSFAYIIPPPLIISDFIHQFSLADLVIYPNLTVLAMFYFIPSIWRGLRRFRKLPPHVQLIASVLVIYFLMIGISLPNLIHQRYRLVYDLFYFAFAIYCWLHRKEWKSKVNRSRIQKIYFAFAIYCWLHRNGWGSKNNRSRIQKIAK